MMRRSWAAHGLAAGLVLATLGPAAAVEDLTAWGNCLPTRIVKATESGELRAAAESGGLKLTYLSEGLTPVTADGQGHLVDRGVLELASGATAILAFEGWSGAIAGPENFVLDGVAKVVFTDSLATGAAEVRDKAKGSITLAGDSVIKVRPKADMKVPRVPIGGDIAIHNTVAGPKVRLLVSQPGTPFDAEKQKALRACALAADADMAVPVAIESVDTKGLALGTALVTLNPPADLFGGGAKVAYLVHDGNELATIGWLSGVSVRWALGISLLATVVIGFLVTWAACGRAGAGSNWRTAKHYTMGLFVGHDGDASLSLFQVYLWSALTLWALVYVFLRTGGLLELTPQVLVLLGLATASSVAARWIASGRESPAATPGVQTTGEATTDPPFWTILTSAGKPDLLKVQLLVFTCFGLVYVAYRVFIDTALPVLGDNLLLLMGVSNLAYIGGKIAEPTPYQNAEAQQRVLDLAKAREQALSQRLTQAKAEHDAAKTAGKPLNDFEKAIENAERELKEATAAVTAADKTLKDLIAKLTKGS